MKKRRGVGKTKSQQPVEKPVSILAGWGKYPKTSGFGGGGREVEHKRLKFPKTERSGIGARKRPGLRPKRKAGRNQKNGKKPNLAADVGCAGRRATARHLQIREGSIEKGGIGESGQDKTRLRDRGCLNRTNNLGHKESGVSIYHKLPNSVDQSISNTDNYNGALFSKVELST